MTGPSDVILKSGSVDLHIAPSTGKIAALRAKNNDLLVRPHEDERNQALSEDGRDKFTSLDAWGGDECFPTIGGSQIFSLRDHGALWARTPEFFSVLNQECSTGWRCGQHHSFKRTVTARNIGEEQAASTHPARHDLNHEAKSRDNVLGVFQFQINFPQQMPLDAFTESCNHDLNGHLNLISTYASHALFAAEPGDTLEWATSPGHTDLKTALNAGYPRQRLASRVFAENQSPQASKFYVQTAAPQIFVTSLIRHSVGIRIDVLQNASLPWVGIWWCHNGWGDGRPHSTIGIEPTNQPSDGPILLAGRSDFTGHSAADFCWVITEI